MAPPLRLARHKPPSWPPSAETAAPSSETAAPSSETAAPSAETAAPSAEMAETARAARRLLYVLHSTLAPLVSGNLDRARLPLPAGVRCPVLGF